MRDSLVLIATVLRWDWTAELRGSLHCLKKQKDHFDFRVLAIGYSHLYGTNLVLSIGVYERFIQQQTDRYVCVEGTNYN